MAFVKSYNDLALAIEYYCDDETEELLNDDELIVRNLLKPTWDKVKSNWKVGKKHGKEKLQLDVKELFDHLLKINDKVFERLVDDAHSSHFIEMVRLFRKHMPEVLEVNDDRHDFCEAETAQMIDQLKKEGILNPTVGSSSEGPTPPSSEGIIGRAIGKAKAAAESISNAASSSQDDDRNCSATKPTIPKGITFRDIVGQETTKSQLLVNYVYPFKYAKLFPRKSKGILLYGPPGTGKSFMAKAATNQVDRAAFFSPAPADLKGKHHGDTEKNIRRFFHCAAEIVSISRKNAEEHNKKNPNDPILPQYNASIIFIDEADTIIGLRTISEMMALSTNAFLQAMDGIDSSPDVSVIAATNFPWNIDSAASRRFGEKILIDKPDKDAIKKLVENEITKIYRPVKEKGLSLPGITSNNMYSIEGVIAHMLHRSPVNACKSTKRIGKTTVVGRLVNSTIEHPSVTHDFLNHVAERMNESEDLRALVNSLKEGKMVDIQLARSDPKKYFAGYSPSDISNVMTNASKTASLSAMKGLFRKVRIVNDEGKDEDVYISSDSSVFDNDEIRYYIKATVEHVKGRNLNSTIYAEIPDSEVGKCMNFTLCPKDILDAIENYPPTINPYQYLQIMRFFHQNISPEEAGDPE